MNQTTVTVFLRQGEKSKRLIFSPNQVMQLKAYSRGAEGITLEVEDLELATQACFRLGEIYPALADLDWKTRLNIYIFQEKNFHRSEKELLDFQVPPEQFGEFLDLCAKEGSVLSGKISFESHVKNFLERKTPLRLDSAPTSPVKSADVTIVNGNPTFLILNNPYPWWGHYLGQERKIPFPFPFQASFQEEFSRQSSVLPEDKGLPLHPPLQKKYRLKPSAPFAGVVFYDITRKGGFCEVSVFSATKVKKPTSATKLLVQDLQTNRNFVVYLSPERDLFVRKFEGEMLGEPVLLSSEKDYKEIEISSDGKQITLFGQEETCRFLNVDLEKGEVLSSFSLDGVQRGHKLDPSGCLYAVEKTSTYMEGQPIISETYLVKKKADFMSRRVISSHSEFVVAALPNSRVVVFQNYNNTYIVYDDNLNVISSFNPYADAPYSRRQKKGLYLWSETCGVLCVLLIRGEKKNHFQCVVYNGATNTWTASLEKEDKTLKLMERNIYRNGITLSQLENGTPVIVTCVPDEKCRLAIISLPTKAYPELEIVFKQKMEKISGRNEISCVSIY